MAPKSPPRAPKASPRVDFHRCLIDFERFVDDFLYHVGWFFSGLLYHFYSYLEVSFSNLLPQVQMCWESAGVSEVTKKCDKNPPSKRR